MPTLFEISQDLQVLEEQLLALEGDIDASNTLVEKWFETLEDRDVKLDNYAVLIQEILKRASVRKEEADRLAMKAKQDENRAKFLKTKLQDFLETHQLKKIETARFTLTLAKNGGKLPLVLLKEAAKIPEDYQKIITDKKPDVERIREALENGETLDFATLGERGYSIRIR